MILTARDVRRGNEAIEKLKAAGCSDVVFHQLDVMDPTTISSLADFIKTHFGKLDILVMQLNYTYIFVIPSVIFGRVDLCLASNYYVAKNLLDF